MIRCALVLGRSLVQLFEFHDREVTIGRDSDQKIRIVNDAVSRRHAVLLDSYGCWTVQDLGRSNGTRLNGRAVDFAPLRSGDAIQVGKHTVLFDPTPEQLDRLEAARPMRAVADVHHVTGTMFMDSNDIEAIMRGVEQQRSAHLRLDTRGAAERRYAIARDALILGSAVDSDVVLRGFFIARQHAAITPDSKGYRLIALSRLRSIRVNGGRVWEHRLRNHDRIRIGPNRFQFFDEV